MEGQTTTDFDQRSGSVEIPQGTTGIQVEAQDKNTGQQSMEGQVTQPLQEPTVPAADLTSDTNKKPAKAGTKKKKDTKARKLVGLPKLDDANEAGGSRSSECTLILTEGDSAKALAVCGLAVVGRDLYGVYPLRGKPLNVREAPLATVQKNDELAAIVRIMGLTYGKVYDDVSDLRYGHLMIMADQDHDGSHIKGLIINLIHVFWPSLLRIPGFLLEFVTPIVRVRRDKEVISFYSTAEFNAWKEKNSMEGWTYKYYKGLGTSNALEARQYFSALDTHRKEFVYQGEADDYAIDLAFSKRKAEERKAWMTEGAEYTGLDESLKKIPFAEFINKELIQFSFADCKRCIPNIMDGLKPGQRKVLYACFKRNMTTSMRVAQLSGYVSETAFYHHGEYSLQDTIVGMAQTYVGAHNVNLLEPEGQFGTRMYGGRDSASPRYIFTKLSPVTRKLFHPADDKLVKYLTEDEASIEPEWYIPIIPMSLVNGTDGIGTGWSTNIPNFNPRDVVENIRRMMRKASLQQMTPWYRGHKGTIECSAAAESFVSNAVWRRVDDETLEVTELPVRYWTNTYRELLESLLAAGKIKSYNNNSSDTSVHFTITIPDLKDKPDKDLVKDLRLRTKISLTNMHLYDAGGRIKKYDTPEQIIEEFYPVRLQYYEKRKEAIVAAQIYHLKRLENKLRFIELVGEGKLQVFRRSREDVIGDLIKFGFDALTNNGCGFPSDAAKEAEMSSFEYLLAMPIGSLTLEDIESLESELKAKKYEHNEVLQRTLEQFWEADLTEFLAALEEYERDLEAKMKPRVKKSQ